MHQSVGNRFRALLPLIHPVQLDLHLSKMFIIPYDSMGTTGNDSIFIRHEFLNHHLVLHLEDVERNFLHWIVVIRQARGLLVSKIPGLYTL